MNIIKNSIISLCLLTPALLQGAYTKITPGEAWNDTSGAFINAHGSGIVFHEGAYYWFGENRSGSTSNGVSCYTSTDLLNWKNLGIVLKTSDTKDPKTGKGLLERPKVMFNPNTGKWIMYCHWENGEGYGEARVAVAWADKVTGPYTFTSSFRPNNHDSRDQTIVNDTEGRGYHICATDMNTNINVALLSEDYLTTADPVQETKVMLGRRLEAPAICRIGDTYFCLFSECDGWNPTLGHSAMTTDLLGEWEELDNFCVDKNSLVSYSTQSTCIIKVDGYDMAYIYVGDRWKSSDVGSSRQVWLPLSVRSGHPVVKWHDSWDPSVFREADRYRRAAAPDSSEGMILIDKYSDRYIVRNNKSLALSDDAGDTAFAFEMLDGMPYAFRIREISGNYYLGSTLGAFRLDEGVSTDDLSQVWYLEVERDGNYNIRNAECGKYLAVSGSSTLEGSPVFLTSTPERSHKSFGIFVDTEKYPEVELAAAFTLPYYEENLKKRAETLEYFAILSAGSPEAGSLITVYAEGGATFVASAAGMEADLLFPDGRKAASLSVAPGCRENLSLLAPSGIYLLHTPSGVSKKIVIL